MATSDIPIRTNKKSRRAMKTYLHAKAGRETNPQQDNPGQPGVVLTLQTERPSPDRADFGIVRLARLASPSD